MTPLRGLLLSAVAAAALAAALPASAQEPQDGQEPALFNADQLTFDDALGLVIASGDVELVQGGRRVLADTITFNQRTSVVTAAGNVRMVEPDGDVLFGEYAELTDDLRQGFIDRVRVLMTDNTRMAGAAAERTDDGRFVRVNRAVYSPCALCAEDPTRAPSWQIRSARVTHDRETRDVVHRDAQVEILGVPVFYSPYLSHPDPTVRRRSGFLTPSFGSDSNLGAAVRSYYYWDIAPQTDATIETTWSQEDGALLGGELRHRFESGRVVLQGSVVQADRFDDRAGRPRRVRDDTRWHLFGTGRFSLTDEWRAGFDVQRTSDDTYLRRYGYSIEDVLVSRYYLEGFRARSYAAVEAFDFQDLRAGNAEEEPLVFPRGSFSYVGMPASVLGGRTTLDGAAVALRRDRGGDYRRLTVAPGWERTWTTGAGVLATLSTRARTDLFWTEDRARRTGPSDERFDARVLPTAQGMLRYPLVGTIGRVHTYVEPQVALTSTPRIGARSGLANEDSRTVELTDRTLFRLDRFPGADLAETGTRLTYGALTGLYGFGGGSTSLFLGQSLRIDGDTEFPRNSGLRESRSDYVGRLRIDPGSFVSADYAVSVRSEDLRVRRQELSASAGIPALTLSASYLYGTDLSVRNGLGPRNETLVAGLSSRLTDTWSFSVSQSRDLSLGNSAILATSAVATYADDCLVVQFIAIDSNVQQVGLDAGRTFYVRFVLRGLGEFSTPRFGLGALFGSDGAAASR